MKFSDFTGKCIVDNAVSAVSVIMCLRLCNWWIHVTKIIFIFNIKFPKCNQIFQHDTVQATQPGRDCQSCGQWYSPLIGCAAALWRIISQSETSWDEVRRMKGTSLSPSIWAAPAYKQLLNFVFIEIALSRPGFWWSIVMREMIILRMSELRLST